MKIKICGINNRENLKQILGLQPDYLGFIFYKNSPRYMKDTLLPADLQHIGVKNTGVFVNSPSDEVEKAIKDFNLDAIQLHGQEEPDYCAYFKVKNIEVIKVFKIDDEFDFDTTMAFQDACHYFLFDTKGKDPGGNGSSFNWNVLKKYNQEIPFFLSGGIGIENMEQIKSLKDLNIYGIDLNSKVEHSAGIKDVNKVRRAISILKNSKTYSE